MPLFLSSIFGSPWIGVYSLATEKMLIVPPQAPEAKSHRLEEYMGAKLIRTTIGDSVLIGALACANTNGIVLPHYVKDEEIEAIKSALDINVAVMQTKRTAYGNMVLANDYGAVADPRLKKQDLKMISDVLGVEVVSGEIAGLPYVGSLAFATNKGVLAHPLIKEEEQKLLTDVLKVPLDVGTVNCGIPYVSTGLIGNSRSVIAGFLTTGPEMFIIEHIFDMVNSK